MTTASTSLLKNDLCRNTTNSSHSHPAKSQVSVLRTYFNRALILSTRRNRYALSTLMLLFISALLCNEVLAERGVSISLATNLKSPYGSDDTYPKIDAASGALNPIFRYLNDADSYWSLSHYLDNDCAGTLAIEEMIVDGESAQILYAPIIVGNLEKSVPYFVLSPIFNKNNTFTNHGPVSLTFKLVGDKPWRLKALGLDVINYDEYLNYIYIYNQNKDTGATGVMKVNGHEVELEKDYHPYSVRVDLSDDERDVSEIKIEADARAAVAFRKITLFLEDEKAEFIELDNEPRATTPEYSFSGIYKIPYCKIGEIDDPTRMACAVFNSQGERMNVTAVPLGGKEPYFQLSCTGEGEDELEEGDYRAVFYLPDGQFDTYQPTPEDGAEFSILPTAYGMYLNWSLVDFSKDIIVVPSHTTSQGSNGQTIQYDWEHVLLNGLRPGTNVYWKVTGDPAPVAPAPTERSVSFSTPRKAPTTIPSDYQKMQNLTVDLSKGSNLSLILNKNGVNSYPIDIQYQRYDVPTIVNSLLDDSSEDIITEWRDLQGNSVANPEPGNILIRISRYPDGHTASEKCLYR